MQALKPHQRKAHQLILRANKYCFFAVSWTPRSFGKSGKTRKSHLFRANRSSHTQFNNSVHRDPRAMRCQHAQTFVLLAPFTDKSRGPFPRPDTPQAQVYTCGKDTTPDFYACHVHELIENVKTFPTTPRSMQSKKLVKWAKFYIKTSGCHMTGNDLNRVENMSRKCT